MKLHINLLVAVMIFLSLIAVGSYTYHNVEGWNTLDSTYFAVMTVTTVGYGDLVPVTNVGKIFTIFFSFLGIVFVFYFISVIGRVVFEKHVKKHLEKQRKSKR